MNVIAEYLHKHFEEVSPVEFYREVFPEGALDEYGEFTPGKYTGIAVELVKDTEKNKVISARRHIITDELYKIPELCKTDNFCLCSPVSYIGKSRKTENARVMYGLVVEIDDLRTDGERQEGIDNLIWEWETFNPITNNTIIPHPTFLVASGNGVHLYYLFDEPLELNSYVIAGLMNYKEAITRLLWNKHVTYSYQESKIQFESPFQGFRMVGTITKAGDRTRAFRTGERVSIDYLNSFFSESDRESGIVIPKKYVSKTSLEEAKEKWPEWYQKVIVDNDKTRKRWSVNRNVYEWWKRQMESGAAFGKRYHCMYCLAVYALKCSFYDKEKNPNPVTEDELREDAYAFIPLFEKLTPIGSKNHFTEDDVEKALQVFLDEGFCNYSLKKIIGRSGIEIKRNDRNYQKQEWHLEDIRTKKANMKRRGQPFKNPEGRPKGSGTAEQKVKMWRRNNPLKTKADCIRATGLSKPTVYKWWGD